MIEAPSPNGGELEGLTVDLERLAHRIAELVVAGYSVSTSQSPWLDVAQAADYLSCSEERVRKLVQRRAIPFHQERAGARLSFHRRELETWLLDQ